MLTFAFAEGRFIRYTARCVRRRRWRCRCRRRILDLLLVSLRYPDILQRKETCTSRTRSPIATKVYRNCGHKIMHRESVRHRQLTLDDGRDDCCWQRTKPWLLVGMVASIHIYSVKMVIHPLFDCLQRKEHLPFPSSFCNHSAFLRRRRRSHFTI